MKIYDSPTAPNPRRVRIFLAEKGIQVPYEPVDIGKAENRSAEFRKKNPLCGIDFGRVTGIKILPEQQHLARWHAAVSARPSAKA